MQYLGLWLYLLSNLLQFLPIIRNYQRVDERNETILNGECAHPGFSTGLNKSFLGREEQEGPQEVTPDGRHLHVSLSSSNGT